MRARYGPPLIAGKAVYGNSGLGVTGMVIRATTATGDHGAGYLYNDWDSGDDDKEFQGLIITPPSAGVFVPYEDGSFKFSDAPDGVYQIGYRLIVDGENHGDATVTITIGSAPPIPPSTPSEFSIQASIFLSDTGGILISIPGKVVIGANGKIEIVPIADGKIIASLP